MPEFQFKTIYHSNMLSHEDQLLLDCATTSISELARQEILKITNWTLDWQYIYRRAFDHKLTPLIYRVLASLCPDAVPTNVLKDMRIYCDTNRRYAFLLSTELLRLIKLLKEKNVSAIPFKGPVLSLLAYDSLDARYYVDLDIFVQEPDIDVAKDILASAGYIPPQDKEQEKLMRKLDYSYTLQNPNNKIEVELHWRIAPTYLSFPYSNTLLWKRKIPLPFLDNVVETFSLEDTFLILCMHGAKHYWHRLSWITDITEFLARHSHLEWSYIVQQAKHLHIYRMLLLTILLASQLENAIVPNDLLLEAHKSEKVVKLAQWVIKWMFVDKIIPVGYFAGYAFQFKIRESWWDKFLYLRWKQPLIHENHLGKDASEAPNHDLFLYLFLRFLRMMRRMIINPIKKTRTKLRTHR